MTKPREFVMYWSTDGEEVIGVRRVDEAAPLDTLMDYERGLTDHVVVFSAYQSALDEVARLRELLQEHLDGEGGTPCRKDHHGYCQAHFLELDCLIERTVAALARKDG